ncbi:MAG: hypothetical protein FWD31_04660 [Planctomycetaceae bacterium]|nr:hypothetical protein [Planctomycetaceae bacterium]
MSSIVLGIDPGVTGAISVIWPNYHIIVCDLPTVMTDGFNGIDPMALYRLIHNLDCIGMVAYCEKSILPPGNGKMTTRSVYDCHGVIRSVLALSGIPLKYVHPGTWKKFHGIPAKSEKEYSRGLAKQLRPDLADYLSRKKDHNRAEALLIAMYGQHQEK